LGRFEQSQKLTQDLLIDLDLQNRGKKPVNDYSNLTPNPSFSAALIENYQYGMPLNYFTGQMPLPGTIRPYRAEPVRSVQSTGQIGASVAGPVRPVAQTGQTGAMVLGFASQPHLTPLPTSAGPSLEEELVEFVLPYTTKSYGEPSFPPPLPKDVWDDWLKSNPKYATQIMSTTDPSTHRLGPNIYW
jgi:hypothetical protein